MQTSLRDRTTRGAFAAAIVIAHVLLAYFLTLSRTTLTSTSPGEGVSVMLRLPGNPNPSELEAARAEVEPQLEEPQPLDPMKETDRATLEIREASSRAPGSLPVEVGLGRPDQPGKALSDTGIAVLRRVLPVYPGESKLAGEQGSTILQVLVDERGDASEVRVVRSSGFARLDESAVYAVEQWKFAPQTKGTTPVAAWGEMELRFNLNRYTVCRVNDAPLDLVPPGGILNATHDTAVPGGDAALQILMSDLDFGSTGGEWSRGEASAMQDALKGWGDVQSIRFAGSVSGNRWRSYEVKPQFLKGSARETVELRWDLYQVWHERGTSEWRIALDRNGRVWCAHAVAAPARWQVSATGR
jgi:periplasmic protein TonB